MGITADLAKRDLPARGRRASSRALAAGRSLSCLYCLSRNTTSGLVSTHPGRRPGAVPKALARGPSPIWRRGNESGLQGFPGHPPPGTGPEGGSAEGQSRGYGQGGCERAQRNYTRGVPLGGVSEPACVAWRATVRIGPPIIKQLSLDFVWTSWKKQKHIDFLTKANNNN